MYTRIRGLLTRGAMVEKCEGGEMRLKVDPEDGRSSWDGEKRGEEPGLYTRGRGNDSLS